MRSIHLLSMAACIAFATTTAVVRSEDKVAQAQVVHFSKLVPFLPDVQGWEAGKAEGNTVEAAGFKMTNVQRNYSKGEQRVGIKIVDYTQAGMMLQGITTAWQFSSETTEGYQKSINLDGQKGWETFENQSKHGQLMLVVGGRFLLAIDANGLPAPELHVWARKLDLKKLAEAK